MWDKKAFKERERERRKRGEANIRKVKAKCKRRSLEGKEAEKRYNRRCRTKRNKQGFKHHKISFPLDVPFDWHHVNKRDVVACPRDIHRNIGHVCGDGKIEGILG